MRMCEKAKPIPDPLIDGFVDFEQKETEGGNWRDFQAGHWRFISMIFCVA